MGAPSEPGSLTTGLSPPPPPLPPLQVWPHSLPNQGIWKRCSDENGSTPHHSFVYSGAYWVAEAIRNSSAYTPDVDSADIVFVDMHCYYMVRKTSRAALPQPPLRTVGR